MTQDTIYKNINIGLIYNDRLDIKSTSYSSFPEVALSVYEKRKFKKIKNEVEKGDFVSLEDFLKENE